MEFRSTERSTAALCAAFEGLNEDRADLWCLVVPGGACVEHVLVSAALEADSGQLWLQKKGIAAKEDGKEIASNITSFCSQQEEHEKASQIIAVYFVPPSSTTSQCCISSQPLF